MPAGPRLPASGQDRVKALAWLLAGGFLLLGGEARAGGGWARPPHSLYLKLSGTTLHSDSYYTSNGERVRTADFSTQTLQLYAEYGVVERLSAVLEAPLLKRAAYVTADAASGIGDVALTLKYALRTGAYPVSIGVGAEFPTGDSRAFGRNRENPQVIIYLPTGDDEFNVWLRGYASHSFHPRAAFISLDLGYNRRTQGFTDQYQLGLELGQRLFDRIWLLGNLRRLATAGTARADGAFSSLGLGEGVEYTSLGGGLSVRVAPHVDLTADISSGLGRIRNIYSGINLGLGLAVELP